MVFNQKKYDELKKYLTEYIKTHESGTEEYRKFVLKKAAEYDLTKEDLMNAPRPKPVTAKKMYKKVMADPNISDYDKNIYQRDLDGKKPRGCYSFQYEYIPPVGTEGYRRFENETLCGKHCVCVDKGVSKKAIDKINKNKIIKIDWACDGEHHAKDPENVAIGQGDPTYRASTIIEYKGKNNKKLNSVIKSVCKTSVVTEHRSGLDVCTHKIPKSKKVFSISSKKRNTSSWWNGLANNLDDLLDVENKPKKSTKKISKSKGGFDLGNFEY